MLTVTHDGPVTHITLARPEVRNALSDVLISQLFEAFSGLGDGCRAVVLAGEGKSFCAGGDLEWMRRAAGYTEEENYFDALALAHLYEAVSTCRPVVIARINGHAFGGGAGLVAACDVAISADSALFSFSEVKLGLVPATISRFVVPKIGHGHARALFTTGEPFGADHAQRIGLVHRVCELDQLDAQVADVLAHVLKSGPEAVHRSKLLAQQPAGSNEDNARLLASVRATPEAQEGISAFLEKRPASFVNA